MIRGKTNRWLIFCVLAVVSIAPDIVASHSSIRTSLKEIFFSRNRQEELYNKNGLSERSNVLGINNNDNVLLLLRGGAKRRSSVRKSRTGSLNSSSKNKSATGKKKVGASDEKDKNKSNVQTTLQKYKNILPLTRIQITMVAITTLIGLVVGAELSQAIMALDPMRTLYGFELWRPFTAATFLGPPSIGWLMSAYYLFEYGSSLERAYGTAQHLIFILTEICVLSVFGIIFGQPFFGQSMITAMLHVLSRAMPHQKVKWLIFTVPYWSLPYGLMASDVLQAQSPAAALPHILGILAGHFYHFHKFVWPKTGGEDWLIAPDFLVQRFDPDARKKQAKDSVNSALMKSRRKRGKGRKLGSS